MRTILTTLHSKFIHPSLALPYLAAYCGDNCGELLIREFTVHEPKETVLAALLAEKPDVIAFSVYLWNRQTTLELVDALEVAAPDVRIVLGGPETSFEGADFFRRHAGVDAVVHGEGEIPSRELLRAWQAGKDLENIPRLSWRKEDAIIEGPDAPPLENLDDIPSPFQMGLTDLSRGFVYYETSRGCPYRCAFCMSALDERVRSFSMERIQKDLLYLMEREVPKIKLVDRTFNYDAKRSRDIFSFILKHNRTSHFHFEIGAHLLDDATLDLLTQVPEGMFQFEIGVQSTLPRTLEHIRRHAPLDKLQKNVRKLRDTCNIHLHLDLIAGLPGEGFKDFLADIDTVASLRPHHLQIEPVKLLPGSPLRTRAKELGIRFDPHPPYTVLGTPDLSFEELERLRGIGRLMDLTCNCGRLDRFFNGLKEACGTFSAGLEMLEGFWREKDLFRYPLSQRALFDNIWNFVRESFKEAEQELLREHLGYDYACSERVPPKNVPDFLDTDLSEEETAAIKEKVRQETERIKGRGIKLQHFAAVFNHLRGSKGRTVVLFIYLTKAGDGMTVKEIFLDGIEPAPTNAL